MNYKLKEKILELRNNGKTYKQIHDELKCSKGTISFHCKKLLNNKAIVTSNIENRSIYLPTRWHQQMQKNVKILYDYGIHTTEISDLYNLNINEVRKFCKHLKSPSFRHTTNYQKVKHRRKKIKILGVLYKGGKCQRCGYDNFFDAFEFHHIDPSKKDFTISHKCNEKWSTIKKELDKCICLCPTCHREEHILINNPKIKPSDFK
jgi:hydroxymethylpyrimidine/phosphomethylpyrimidine kinase